MSKVTVLAPCATILTPMAHMIDYPSLIEQAGRTCYRSGERITPSSSNAFCKKVIELGHFSVLEHCGVTVRITCSRSCSHQLVRHRLGAYSQESQRYVNYRKDGSYSIVLDPGMVDEETFCCTIGKSFSEGEVYKQLNAIPPVSAFRRPDANLLFTMLEQCGSAFTAYEEMISLGAKPEAARHVLPNATKTEIVATYNLRQWRHVIETRALGLHGKPQAEIKMIFDSILNQFMLADGLSVFFSDLKSKQIGGAK